MVEQSNLDRVCIRVGLRAAELSCVPEAIPEPIALASEGAYKALREHGQGFGMVGNPGAGKTGSVAIAVREMIERFGQDWPPVRWIYWPEQAEILKAWSSSNRYNEVEEWFETVRGMALVVIDDLGRERRRNDNDLSLGILDRLISARSRDLAPIIWTSNATLPELVETYGGPFTSRLFGMAPPIVLPALPDLRLRRAK